jgi:hypothetical protein
LELGFLESGVALYAKSFRKLAQIKNAQLVKLHFNGFSVQQFISLHLQYFKLGAYSEIALASWRALEHIHKRKFGAGGFLPENFGKEH